MNCLGFFLRFLIVVFLNIGVVSTDRKIQPGDCFSYCGAAGWYYLYDHDNVIIMKEKNPKSEKLIFDLLRKNNIPFKQLNAHDPPNRHYIFHSNYIRSVR